MPVRFPKYPTSLIYKEINRHLGGLF